MKGHKKEIAALRKKLPAKGWVAPVLEFAVDKKGNPLVTEDQVKNLFQLKSVKKESAVIIIAAAVKAVKKIEEQDASMKEMLESV